MKIRELDNSDMDAITEFIIDAYNDYPLAMWFESEPGKDELERLFYNKMRGISSRALVDVVVDDNGTIAGECEIARTGFDSGVIGIIVRHGYRGQSVGSGLLQRAIDDAVSIGITKFTAEIAEGNNDALTFFVSQGFTPVGFRGIERSGKEQKMLVLTNQVR